jgi:nitroimidazol reductase NimA-like FMN-containing flavoprotein (pyridoxamine 5'-phosphate oxidase superfamily)|tara:strand:+ start:3230 stop:3760 length:531 start_codon:yes stop_codon:yes gene_type:complete
VNEKEKYEAWETRRNISSFTLAENEIEEIINDSSHAVVSWVTKSNEPVTAVMLYVVIDGQITVTSTTNRAKYHAWKRNPATSFCIWDHKNIGKQVTLRGIIHITKDDELLYRYTEAFLTRAMGGNPPSKKRLEREIATFQAPDRHMMQLQVQSKLSHDLNALLAEEQESRHPKGQS